MASNITVIIQAKDNASKVLMAVAKTINKMPTGQAASNINLLSTAISVLGGKASVLGATFDVLAKIFTVVNDLAYRGAKFDRLEQGADSLGKQYAMTSQEIIAAVDKITKGTLSKTAILQQANQAMLLGVAHSEEELTTLAAIAADRGRKMGISMEKAFSSIVLGVGRLSPLILDNLGIILDADVTYAKYAKTIGKTADSLTDMEKRQALLNRLKEEMKSTKIQEDDMTSWEKLGASINNATTALGEWINKYLYFEQLIGGIADVTNSFAGAVDVLTPVEEGKKRLSDLQKQLKELEKSYKESQEYIFSLQKTGQFGSAPYENREMGMANSRLYTMEQENLLNLSKEIQKVKEGIAKAENDIFLLVAPNVKQEAYKLQLKRQALLAAQEEERINQENILIQEKWNNIVGDYASLLDISKHEAELLAQELYDGQTITQELVDKFRNFVDVLEDGKEKAEDLKRTVEGIQSGVRNAAVQAYIDAGLNENVLDLYKQKNEELQKAVHFLQVAGYSEDELAFRVAAVEEKYSSVFNSISESVKETQKLSTATAKVSEEYSKIESTVSGIVQDMYEDIGVKNLDDFLPREDAPNEAARRIADVMVKGFESPWATYFKDTFPDLFTKYSDLAGGDVKKAAGLLLKDFQAGLNPELIDKEKVKELAKRMLMADQASKAMIDEISKELADEMQISLTEATGAVSSAFGKKEPLTSEQVQKIIQDAQIKPDFDLSSSKKDFEQAAKDVGLADENGKISINVTALINEVKKSDELPASALTITTGLKFPTEDIIQLALDIHYPSLYLNTNLKITKENLDGFTTILNSMMESNPALIYASLTVSNFSDFIYQTQESLKLQTVNLPVNFLSTTAEQFSTLLTPFVEQLKTSFEGEGGIAAAVAKSLEESMMDNQEFLEFQGITFAAHFFNGFSNSGVGRSLAFELNRQLGESESLIEASGKSYGGKWGQSFLEVVGRDVPFELLSILVNLITPEVKKRVAEEKTRQ
jgi:hypothetical protein